MKVSFSNLNVASFNPGKSLGILVAAGLLAIFSGGIALAAQPHSLDSQADITVYKTANCGCCKKWTDQLQHIGLNVDVILVEETGSVRSRLGVPEKFASCHTAVVAGYWVEGHVPPDLVHQLMYEQPENIKGIAVPGMVPGSPGMEVPNPGNYNVLSVDDSGNIAIYATRKGQSTP